MKRVVGLFLLILVFVISANAQGYRQQSRQLVDLPTAGTLERGSFAIDLRMYNNGGLIGGVGVGISPRFMFGLSFGGENIIGEGGVNWNETPGIQASFRIIDESFGLPAVTIGFSSQGYGPYRDSLNRYVNKSRGFFGVVSKNYAFFYNLGLHGGANYSLETDDEKDINFFLGADLSLNREVRIILEYDFAINDNSTEAQFGSGSGYLNAGAQWSFSDRLFLQFNLKNLLENGPGQVTREFKIGYFEYF